jgi:translocation and assembly module TamB
MAHSRASALWMRTRRWSLRALWLLPSIAAALVVVLLLTMNLGPTRRFVCASVNDALSELFVGQIELERIGSLRLDAISGVDARVFDASRRRVLSVRGLSVRSNWPQIVQALLLGRPLEIALEPLSADHLDVLLVADSEGVPTLARAFLPRQSTPSSPPKAGENPAPSIAIRRLHVRHIWAHGSLPSVPVIDAEIRDLRGAFEQDAKGLSAKLEHGLLTSRGLPLRLNPSGALKARLAQTGAATSVLSGFSEFRGTIASAPATLRAELNGQKLEALLQAPAVPPATVREFLPDSRLEVPTTLEASVHGSLPELDFGARLQSSNTEAQVQGHASLQETTRLNAELTATELNLRTLFGATPETRLSLEASANAVIANGGTIAAGYRLAAASGRFGDQETPPLSSEGKLTRDRQGDLWIDGQLDVKEPGARTRADYRLQIASTGAGSLHTELQAQLEQPPRLQRLAELRVAGVLSASADLDLESERFKASAKARLSPVVHPSARMADLELKVDARGALSSPELELAAEGHDVSTPIRHFQRLKASARGGLQQMRVALTADCELRRRFQAGAQLALAEGLVVNEPSVAYTDSEGLVTAQARRIRVASGAVRIEELALTGMGDARANATLSEQRLDADFAVHALDLGRLARLSGLGFAERGTLTLEGKLSGPYDNLTGTLQGQGSNLEFKELRGGSFELDLAIAQRRLNGTLAGRLGRSQLAANLSDLDLPVAPLSPAKLRALRGALSLKGQVELSQLTPALRAANVPLERAQGRVTLEIAAEHPRAAEGKERIEAHVRSEGLSVVTQRKQRDNVESPGEAKAAEPFALEGIDADVRVTLDPQDERAKADVSLFDHTGALISLNAEARVAGLSTLHLTERLDTVPLRVTVRTPERALQTLPSVVRPSVMRGVAQLQLEARGTVRAPELQGTLVVRRLQAREGRNSVDLRASIEYENAGGKLDADARATRGGTSSLRASWVGNLVERARGTNPNHPIPLELGADLTLDRFPVALVPDLSDNQVRGPLSGELHLRGLGKDARLEAKFDGSGMTVNRVAMPKLLANVRADGRALTATLEALQSQGNARAEFSAPSNWGERWAPELTSRANLSLKARAFELEAIAPLVASYVSALEGQLDANFSAELDPDSPDIQGSATLRDGVIQLPTLGQRFSDVQARLSVRDNELRVDDLQARGITGRLSGDARARLSGITLQSASARVEIKEKEKLPITLEGVMIGDAWGHATLAYSHPNPDSPTEIKIDVPAWRLQMPDAAQNSVQDLDAAEDIRIGTRRSDGEFAAIPLQPFEAPSVDELGKPPSLTRVHVHLGDSVWVERGRQATVQLTGDLEIRAGAEQEVTGRIELRGGKLDVSGKQFEIERGVVSFEGDDPGNPTVTATARWDSPAEYSVYAEYSGTVQGGKLKLRSEPALTQDEILSLLLFGTPGGGVGGGTENSDANATGTAVSVAGDTATRGLNRAISDVTSLDVSTRIDTSTGSARPELVVQLTPRLTSRLTRAIGDPAPGESPDRTFITLELRLLRSWAISGVVGDHGGSALDLIWRNRY